MSQDSKAVLPPERGAFVEGLVVVNAEPEISPIDAFSEGLPGLVAVVLSASELIGRNAKLLVPLQSVAERGVGGVGAAIDSVLDSVEPLSLSLRDRCIISRVLYLVFCYHIMTVGATADSGIIFGRLLRLENLHKKWTSSAHESTSPDSPNFIENLTVRLTLISLMKGVQRPPAISAESLPFSIESIRWQLSLFVSELAHELERQRDTWAYHVATFDLLEGSWDSVGKTLQNFVKSNPMYASLEFCFEDIRREAFETRLTCDTSENERNAIVSRCEKAAVRLNRLTQEFAYRFRFLSHSASGWRGYHHDVIHFQRVVEGASVHYIRGVGCDVLGSGIDFDSAAVSFQSRFEAFVEAGWIPGVAPLDVILQFNIGADDVSGSELTVRRSFYSSLQGELKVDRASLYPGPFIWLPRAFAVSV